VSSMYGERSVDGGGPTYDRWAYRSGREDISYKEEREEERFEQYNS
jgi:hypothetical protein